MPASMRDQVAGAAMGQPSRARIRPDWGRAATVSEIVEEYPTSPTSLRREYVVVRIALREDPEEPQRIAVRLVMKDWFWEGRHDMDPLSTGQLRPG